MAQPAIKRLHSELSPEKMDTSKMDPGMIKALMHEVLAETGLDTIKDEIKGVTSELNQIKQSIDFAHQVGDNASKKADENKQNIAEMQTELENLKIELKQEREARLKLDVYSRRSNLRFYGVAEMPNEKDSDCERAVIDLFKNKMGLSDPISIERCHRLGPKPQPNDPRPRPIIVRFSFFKDRARVWSAKRMLAGTRILVKEDHPPEVEKRVTQMTPIFLAARKNPEFTNVKLVVDKLFINGSMYTPETIDRLPNALQPENLASRTDGQITWFFRKQCHLSNHFPCEFTDKDGSVYNSMEQYYTAHKALFFDDKSAHATIMGLKDPVSMMRVRIKNFKSDAWKGEDVKVMKSGLLLKYDQNPILKDKLLQTKDTVLCEANPKDSYWGSGISMYHPDAADTVKWGTNHLGRLIQEVREHFK